MDIPDVQVMIKGTQISLKDDRNKAMQALITNEWLVLKKATSLAQVEPILEQKLFSLDAVTKGIALNSAVTSVLFSAQKRKFRISGHLPLKLPVNYPMSQDDEAAEIRKSGDLVAIQATHLGGDNEVKWTINVEGNDGKMEAVEANGGDVFMCSTALKRSPPSPNPKQSPQHAIVISYLWEGFSDKGTLPDDLVRKLVKVGEGLVSQEGKYVLLDQA
ncbi:MAG: hypothetical protein M1824_001082 [Vezdaea acicularis]|nr:MAG: hypothetical protein M1824_001082 [Vezdaea acicularis]